MKLKQLLKDLEGIEVRGSREVEILSITSDSRTASPGCLFIARKGRVHDGIRYLWQVVEAGASAVVAEYYDPFLPVVQILCENPAFLEAKLASRFYRRPSEELLTVGITGSKGKTTTTYAVRHLLEGLGMPCGLIGTVEVITKGNRFPASLTTHGVIQNQHFLREMVSQGCRAVAFEVSSHGLAQGRVEGISFDIALFTNLFPDHLDYHKSIEDYASTKRKLFEKAKRRLILNADSPWASFMSQGREERSTFGWEGNSTVRGSELECSSRGMQFWVEARGEKALFQTPFIGKFNAYNLLGAIAVGIEVGAPLRHIAEILSSFQSVPGRLERVSSEGKAQVFVDYCHTGESMEYVLKALREMGKGRLLVVFGCGGNRDPGRRRGMAQAAERGADLAIITSDNPRQEDPEEICHQILSSFQNPGKALVELDRKKAIFRAISLAEPGDLVLVAGKGHEKVQIFAHQTLPFDDVAVAKEALLCCV